MGLNFDSVSVRILPRLILPLRTRSCNLSAMTLADDILSLVTRKPGLTEVEIAKDLFGRLGYQQRHPFSYHQRIVDRA